jgi:outer membrane protein assembly factor BamB
VILDNGLITASCGSGGGGNYLVTVNPAAPGQPARVAYRVDRKAPYVPTPIARDGLLFLISDDGVASCLRQDDGTEVWRERVGGTFFGSPIWVDGKIYAVNAGGEVVVLQAGEEFKLLGRTELNDLCHTTPAVANGRLYIRTYEHLLAIGAK